MVRWIFVTIVLIISTALNANGFLFTPTFQIFLNQMQQTGHQDFVSTWDFNKQNNFHNGFSHTTNQFGKWNSNSLNKFLNSQKKNLLENGDLRITAENHLN